MKDASKKKKRPADLATLRQRQLEKRRKAASEPKPAPSTAKVSLKPQVLDEQLRLPAVPVQVQFPPAKLPIPPTLPAFQSEPSVGTIPGEPIFRMFGKPLPTVPTSTDTPINTHSNPFLAARDAPFAQPLVKKKNPFSIFNSMSHSAPTVDDLMQEDGPEENIDPTERPSDIGQHVVKALQAQRRTPFVGTAPSLPRSHSCPAGLVSPNVSLSKRPRTFLDVSTHYRDDSDASLSSEEEDDISDVGLSEDDDEERGADKTDENSLSYSNPDSNEDQDENEAEAVCDTSSPLPDDAEPSKESGALLDLLTGKRLKRGDITEQELSAIVQLSRTRSAMESQSPPRPLNSEQTPRDPKPRPPVAKGKPTMNPNELPIDWTIKTSFTILSRKPFACAAQMSSTEEANCLMTFVQDGVLARSESDMLKDSLHQHLYHWSYPPDRLPPSHIALMTKVLAKDADRTVLKEYEQLELEHFKRSEEIWKDAFRSLFIMLRHNHVNYFYYINSQFAVLFLSQSKICHGKYEAVMSSSTAGIRKCLDAEDIKYEITAVQTSGALRPSDKSELDDPGVNDAAGSSKPDESAKSPAVGNGKPSEGPKETLPLRFRDRDSVDALYKFLQNWKEPRTDRRAMQLPTLLSLKPFLHASLKSAQVLKNDKVRYNLEDPKGGQKIETMHKLQISGCVLPTSVSGLLSLIRAQQAGSQGLVTATLKTEEKTTGINAAMAAVEESGVKGEGKGLNIGTIGSVAYRGNAIRWRP